MTEGQIWSFMQVLDDDLMENEWGNLMAGIEMDVASISQKTHDKIRKQQEKVKGRRKKMWIFAAAAWCILVGTSTVYASEIKDFFKFFLNKAAIYSTVVEGQGYYLDVPVKLDDGGELRKVIFAGGKLELVLTLPSGKQTATLSVRADDGHSYTPAGYSRGPQGVEASFNNISPSAKIYLTVDDKEYPVALTAGVSLVSGSDIIPAEENAIDWVHIGYRRVDDGVQIVTDLVDKNLDLIEIGAPKREKVNSSFSNKDHGLSTTSSRTKPLIGADKDGNTYEYVRDPQETGRPLTVFTSNAPAGKEIKLTVPSIIVDAPKELVKVRVNIPALNEKIGVDQEIDLGLQKMVLQSVKRTSEATAELKFALNTGNQTMVAIREAVVESADAQSGELLWENSSCTMQLTFDKAPKTAELVISWPSFVINGNWVLLVR
ncbi:MAG: hypothetical protein VB035_03770 [Candidatus Fimivivens sp.]|nr:hypothetical protein [Candidatus Fimivivens sp.]